MWLFREFFPTLKLITKSQCFTWGSQQNTIILWNYICKQYILTSSHCLFTVNSGSSAFLLSPVGLKFMTLSSVSWIVPSLLNILAFFSFIRLTSRDVSNNCLQKYIYSITQQQRGPTCPIHYTEEIMDLNIIDHHRGLKGQLAYRCIHKKYSTDTSDVGCTLGYGLHITLIGLQQSKAKITFLLCGRLLT